MGREKRDNTDSGDQTYTVNGTTRTDPRTKVRAPVSGALGPQEMLKRILEDPDVAGARVSRSDTKLVLAAFQRIISETLLLQRAAYIPGVALVTTLVGRYKTGIFSRKDMGEKHGSYVEFVERVSLRIRPTQMFRRRLNKAHQIDKDIREAELAAATRATDEREEQRVRAAGGVPPDRYNEDEEESF